MLEKLMAFTGVEATQTLMIGDTIHDLNMAASAGCDGLGVSYGAHAAETLRMVAQRAVLHSVQELGNWLKQNA
jgi:phosphoglycolate phosphatase